MPLSSFPLPRQSRRSQCTCGLAAQAPRTTRTAPNHPQPPCASRCEKPPRPSWTSAGPRACTSARMCLEATAPHQCRLRRSGPRSLRRCPCRPRPPGRAPSSSCQTSHASGPPRRRPRPHTPRNCRPESSPTNCRSLALPCTCQQCPRSLTLALLAKVCSSTYPDPQLQSEHNLRSLECAQRRLQSQFLRCSKRRQSCSLKRERDPQF
mmetsp:Transcript_6964/g.13689  ORF Transcript_6964/g.13689 Transcript_6964/m.13689 type:complete len:208 (-) Transcript_6964:593-1216(-)